MQMHTLAKGTNYQSHFLENEFVGDDGGSSDDDD